MKRTSKRTARRQTTRAKPKRKIATRAHHQSSTTAARGRQGPPRHVLAAVFILALVGLGVFTLVNRGDVNLTGLVTQTDVMTQSLVVATSTLTEVPMTFNETPTSLTVTGRLLGTGDARITFVSGNRTFVVYDSAIGTQGLGSLTGNAVVDTTFTDGSVPDGEQIPADEQVPIDEQLAPVIEESTNASVVNETTNATTNETANNVTNETSSAADGVLIDKSIIATLRYGQDSQWDIHNNGIEASGQVIDVDVMGSEFSWSADDDKTCTRWTIVDSSARETETCTGSVDCCAFLGLNSEPGVDWKTLQVYDGRYGADALSSITAQVVYYDVNLSLENLRTDVVYSQKTNALPLRWVPISEVRTFENRCQESCSLPSGVSNGTLRIEVTGNATVELSSVSYELMFVPQLVWNGPENVTIAANSSWTGDISTWFVPNRGNARVTYDVQASVNLNATLIDDVLTIVPDARFIGERDVTISASAGQLSVSHTVTVIVVDGSVVNMSNMTGAIRIILKNKDGAIIGDDVVGENETKQEFRTKRNKTVGQVRGQGFGVQAQGIGQESVPVLNTITFVNPRADGEVTGFVDSLDAANATDSIGRKLQTDVIALPRELLVDSAEIILQKNGPVTGIVTCPAFNFTSNSCPVWEPARVPFVDNGTHVVFTVTHFSGYAGANITIINVQSYPLVGGTWTVEFTSVGTAPLVITPYAQTTFTEWPTDDNETIDDLEFQSLTCDSDDVGVEHILNGTARAIFVSSYSCDGTGRETSRVLTSGVHDIEFRFGDDVGWAHNDATNPPTLTSAVLTNTGGNLTAVSSGAADADGDRVTNITNWYVNNVSLTLLNLALNTNISTITFGSVRDYSAYRINATIINRSTMPIWIQNCSYGGCYQFRNFSGYIDAGDAIAQSTTNITIETWINATGTSWLYKRPLVFTSPTPYAGTVIELNLNTTNFNYSHTYNNGMDVRFADAQGNALYFWIEQWNSSGNSIVWVNVTVANTPYIMMYYGNPSVPTQNPTWTGAFMLLSNQSCPTGWSRVADLDGKFLRGNSVAGGTGGSSTHTHGISITSDGGTHSGASWARGSEDGTGPNGAVAESSHVFSGTSGSGNNVPSYKEFLVCGNRDFTPTSGMLAISNTSTQRTGWNAFAAIYGRFPVAQTTYGTTGNGAAHTVSIDVGSTGTFVDWNDGGCCEYVFIDHTHTMSTTSGSTESIPSYLTVLYVQRNASPSVNTGIVVFTNVTPPLGWSLFSPLVGKFPLGNDTYGASGGSDTHSHSVSGTSDSVEPVGNADASSGTITPNHYHTVSGNTNAGTSLPAYKDVIFIQRVISPVNVTFGDETVATIGKPGAIGLGTNGTTVFATVNNQSVRANLNNNVNHVVLTYNGTSIALYINGTFAASAAVTGALPRTTYNFTIGDGFNGTLDEVKVYNRSLSAEQIVMNYVLGLQNRPIDTIVAQETIEGQQWYANITPNDGFIDGSTKQSNVVTIATLRLLTSPSDTYTAALTFNGSVDGVLTGGQSYSSAQNVTFNGTSVFAKLFTLFNESAVDLSKLTIQNVTGKISINTSGVTGIAPTHTLYLPLRTPSILYVCPGANITAQVTWGCAGMLNFTQAEAAAVTRKTGVSVSIDNGYWVIQNLTGSGGGDADVHWMNYTNPTLANNSKTNNSWVAVNISIFNATDLKEFIWNWNGTNYSMYNDSLVLMMNFDNVSALEENTTHVKDLSKWGNNGTLGNQSAATQPIVNTTGRFGGAYEFDGFNDFITSRRSNELELNGTGATLSIWFKFRTSPVEGTFMDLLEKYDAGDPWGGYNLRFVATGGVLRLDFVYYDAVTGLGLTSYNNGIIRNETWYQIVVTHDSASGYDRLFINSMNVAQDSGRTQNIKASIKNFSVGYFGGIGRFFNGTLDEVRVWNRSLSQTEINQQFYSNIYKFDVDKWVFWSNQSNLTSGNYSYFAYASDTLGNFNQTVVQMVAVDNQGPVVAQMLPSSGFNSTTYNITFMCNATDDIALRNITLYVWNSSGNTLYTNTTNFSNTYSTLNTSYVVPYEGLYKWNCLGTDTFGSQNWSTSGNYTVTYNARAAISYVNPSIADGLQTRNTSVVINVSIMNETDLKQFIWNWNGTNYSMHNDSLVLMMNFDNVSSLGENTTHVKDLSKYGNNGTCYSGNTPLCNWTTDGKYRSGVIFDGMDDTIRLPNFVNAGGTSGSVTFASWFKINTRPSDAGYAWTLISSGGGLTPYVTYTLQFDNQTISWMRIKHGVGNSFNIYRNNTLEANNWYYLTGTSNGTNAKLYIDDVEVNSTVVSDGDNGVAGTNTETNITIGRQYYTGDDDSRRYINGTIDEVRIWNRSLSTAEVQQQYYSTLYKFDVDKWAFYTNQTLNISKKGSITYFASVIDTLGNQNTTETRLITINNTKPVAGSPALNTTAASNNTNANLTLWYSSATDINSDRIVNITNWYVNNASLTFLYLPFETNSTNDIITDYSGAGLTGSIDSTPLWNHSGGKAGLAGYQFDGLNDFIRVSYSSILEYNGTANWTIALWFNARAGETDNGYIISKPWGGSGEYNYRLIFSTDQTLQFILVGNHTNAHTVTSTGPISRESWHFVAINLYANKSLVLSLDGQFNAATVHTIGAWNTSYGAYPMDLAIGTLYPYGEPWVGDVGHAFNGSIDDVMIFNRSLSNAQIRALYLNRTDLIVAQETEPGQTWYANVTPNDGTDDGTTVQSNMLTITTTGRYSATTHARSALFTATGSVDGVLSSNAYYDSAQNVTYTNGTRKLITLFANFNDSVIDLSNLIIDETSGKIALNTSGVSGIQSTHTLYLPVNNRVGIYVCPGANTTDQVTPGCEGQLNFSYTEAVAATRKSGVTVGIDSNYWVIQNLTGSGGGEASCTGTLPPATGDWTIADTTYCEDGSIYLNGNLTIFALANLTLENATLIMNTSDSQSRTINNSGNLDANYTNITSMNSSISSPEAYRFFTAPGGSLDLQNSIVVHAGEHTGTYPTYYGYGINILANHSRIINTTIVTANLSSVSGNSKSWAIYGYLAQNLSILRNRITTYGQASQNWGIVIENVNSSFISNNSITTYGAAYNYGMYLVTAHYNTVSNNSIVATGTTDNYGIYLFNRFNNATLRGNRITSVGTGSSNWALYLNSVSYNSIYDTIINASGDQYSYGIELSAQHNLISNASIVTYGTSSDAIGIDVAGHNNTIANVSISTFGTVNNYGIYVSARKNTRIFNASITTQGTDSSHGIYLTSTTSNTTILNSNIRTNNVSSYGLYLTGSTQETIVQNTVIQALQADHLQIQLGNAALVNHFINVTMNYTNITFIGDPSGQLNVSWYTRVFVNTSVQTALAGASVNVSSIATGVIAWSNVTPASGYSDWYITPGYIQNNSGIFSSQNHTFNATYPGLMSAFVMQNVTESMTVNITLTESACMNITSSGTYTLLNNVTSPYTCMQITANNVVLDCQGYTILYGTAGTGNGVNVSQTNTPRINNITIRNCRIDKSGTADSDNYGVRFTNVSNSTITNTSIFTDGGSNNYGINIETESVHTLVEGSTVLADGSAMDNHVIFVSTSSENTTIRANNVTSLGDGSGVAVSSARLTTIANTTIYVNGFQGFSGVSVTSSNQTTIDNTSITSIADSNAYGFSMSENSVNTTILRSDVLCQGMYYMYCLSVLQSSHILIQNSTVTGIFDHDGQGITLSTDVRNVTVRGSTINVTGAYTNYGVLVSYSNSSTIYNNTILVTGTYGGRGIVLSTSWFNNIQNNSISIISTDYNNVGVSFDAGSDNILSGGSIVTGGTTASYGIEFYADSDRNNISSTNVLTTNVTAYGVYFWNSGTNRPEENRLRDTKINSTRANHVHMTIGNTSTNYLINVTFNQTNITLEEGINPSGQLDVAWLVRSFVNSTYLTSISGANVTARANDNAIVWSNITDGSGYSDWYATTAYIQNNSGIFEKNNYTFSAFASSLPLYGTTTFVRNISGSMTVNITMRDVMAPAILFVNPTIPNNTRTTNTSVVVNVSLQNTTDLSIMQWNWNGTNYSMYNDSLLLLYNFDNVTDLGENSTHVKDVSKWGNNGTCYTTATTPGCTWSYGGKYQRAMYFDGNDDWMDIPNVNIGNFFSFEVWLNASDMTTIGMILTNVDVSQGADENGFKFFINSYPTNDRRIVFETGNGGGGSGIDALSVAGNVTANVWHHVVVTVNRSQSIARIYINGRNMTAVSTIRNDFDLGGDWRIGDTTNGGTHYYFYKGLMDNLQIWNYSLSDAEIAQHYYSTLYKYTNDTWVFWSNQTGIYQGNVLTGNERGNISSGNYTFFAYSKDGSGNENSTELRTIAADTRAPDVSLLLPVSGFNATTYNVTFLCNATDDVALQNITLYVWNSTGGALYTNTTNFSNTYSTLNASFVVPGEGVYSWNCLGADTFGNQLWSSTGNSTVTYNARAAIAFVNPTILNNTLTTSTNVVMNVSVLNETDLKQFIWNWNGTNYSMYNDSLVLMMNFDNVSALGENATHVKDLSKYGNNGTCYDGATPTCSWTTAGKYSGGIYFDGSNDYISVPDSSALKPTSAITLSAWVNCTTSGEWNGIIDKTNNGDPITSGYALRYCTVFYFTLKTATANVDFYSGVGGGDGRWHHIVGTYDSASTRIRMYVDNVIKVDDTTSASGNIVQAANPLNIGRGAWTLPTRYLTSSVDELQIHSRALTVDQISQHYYSVLYKFDVDKWAFYTNQTLNLTNRGILTYQATAIDTVGNLNSTELRELTILNTPPVIASVLLNTTLGMNSTLENLTLRISANDTNRDPITNITNWFVDNVSITVLNMPFDTNVSTNATNAVRDYSPYQNYGTLGGGISTQMPIWNASSKVGGGYMFDGLDDYINISNSSSTALTSQGTISLWVSIRTQPPTHPDGYTFIAKGINWMVMPNGYFISYIKNNGCAAGYQLRFDIGNGTAYSAPTVCGVLTLGHWYHVVASWNTTNATLYVNGTLAYQSGTVTPKEYNVSMSIGAGRPLADTSLGNFTNGSIDEVMIFNRTLSAQQIYQLFLDGNASHHLEKIVAHETVSGETWYANVTPNDGFEDGTTAMSNSVTIRATQAPAIVNITTPALASIVEAGVENLTFGVTVEDNDTRLDMGNVNLTFSFESTARINTSCRVDQQLSAVRQNYSCTVSLWYFDPAGVWTVNATAVDLSGQVTPAYGTSLVVMETTAIAVGPSNITWSQLLPGMLNATAAVNITVNNTGNKNITPNNMTINATDLVGLTNPAFYLPVTNFSIGADWLGDSECAVDTVANMTLNNTFVSIVGANLSRGNLSQGSGTAQEVLYLCLREVPTSMFGTAFVPQRYVSRREWILQVN